MKGIKVPIEALISGMNKEDHFDLISVDVCTPA